jgi:triphosphoribosyl-dephospho-CoA synthetase
MRKHESKIPRAFAEGILVEALAEGKLSTVSGMKQIKDLTILKFVRTSTILHELFLNILRNSKAGKIRIGPWISKGIKEVISDQLIKTNTCLGYLMLTVPLAIASLEIGASSPEQIVLKASEIIKVYGSQESASKIYEAIRIASPSYSNKYDGPIPDIKITETNVSFYDIINISKHWDIVAFELYNGYPYTIKAIKFLRKYNTIHEDLLQAVAKSHIDLSSIIIDTSLSKGFGLMWGSIVRYMIYEEKQKNNILLLDKWLRENALNLGSISDILAAATALNLLSD